jgi:ubiquinone/menaquinone biosynthesis C-methylase UbiE
MASKTLVQQQFGAHAEAYVRSAVHAHGDSLRRLAELADPQPDWLALDVAPGGGHSALAIARRARLVVALDITFDMLAAARAFGRQQGLDNVFWLQGDGERLPFPAAVFDLITCRVALHHFPHQAAAVRAWARALKPGGRLALVDNISPDDAAAAAYVNAFEKLRDPSHGQLHPLDELIGFCQAAGLSVQHSERLLKPMGFHAWMERMGVPPADRAALTDMLWGSQGPARDFLAPQGSGDETTFSLHEGIILATKTGAARP